MGIEDFVEVLMQSDEVSDDFALWAFGENYPFIEGSDKFADAWNELHSDLHCIKMSSVMHEEIVKLVNFWREFGKS